jgi:hypothetical protein
VNNPLPTFDLRTLDPAGFRRWLAMHLARWATDPAFVQRSRVRDLRRAHPDLRRLEEDYRRAVAADVASPLGPRLQETERQLYDAGKALSGLAEAILRAGAERRPSLEAKRDAFLSRQRALDEERAALTHTSPERRELLRATAALDQFRAAIGLDREEAALNELLTKRGRGSGRAGTAFEEEALEVTRERIAPSDAHILQTVRLGAAGVELDVVVVRQPGGPDAPVEVLAVVEAKRNANDLGHGFSRRQIDLAWLTGDRAAYDPAEHRTGTFDAGHFDRPAAHWQDGRPFVFAPGSFGRFARNGSGHFRDGLWLVTRAGPVWGLSGAALSRVAAAVSTDEAWDPDDETKLARLFAWARSLAGPVETPDVVNLYSDPARAGQLIVLEIAHSAAKAAK